MYNFEIKRGELKHLTNNDCREIFAILTTLSLLRPPNQRLLVEALKACLCDENNKDPWFVVHDEDLISLHRRDDDKPVVMFVTKEFA